MKKKLILFLSVVAMLTLMLALSISATTYNYYENEIGENNLLYSVEVTLATDSNANYAASPRYQLDLYDRGDGFAMYDGNGVAISWYVVSDTTDENGVRNIVVNSAPTIGGVGTMDANGAYTYGGGTVEGVTSKQIVSANFFGTGVKTLPKAVFMAEVSATDLNAVGIKNTGEYCCVAAPGGYLMYLYLPKTLKAIPEQMCYRSPVKVVEFENDKDNPTVYKDFPGSAFQFCARLESISLPEGITAIGEKYFREALSLEYVKFPSTMTQLNNNIFWRSNGCTTIVLGENMTTVCGISTETARFYVGSPTETMKKRFIYVPESVVTLNNNYSYFSGIGSTDFIVFYMGSLEQAAEIEGGTDFINALKNAVSYDEYLQRKNYYDNEFTGSVLIYNVLECDVYYGGEHNDSGNVGTKYIDSVTPFESGSVCTRCSQVFDTKTCDPILTFLGYSVQETGDKLCLGYNTNKESWALCPDISIGILVAPGDNADVEDYEPLNPDNTPNVDSALISAIVDKNNTNFNITIKNYSEEYYDRNVIMCAYVTDGKKVDYLCLNDDNELVQQEYAKTITFRDVVEGFVAKYRVKVNYDSGMGTVDKPSQAIRYGESATVTATPNEGYAFLGWSNGDTSPTIEFTPTEHTTLKANFIPASTKTVHDDGTVTEGLPVMSIYTEGGLEIATKEYYINCEISLLDNTGLGKSVISAGAEIKGRGNSTWNLEKKPYKFKFESKQNLFGFGKEKTWVLLADHRDYSLLRNMLALSTTLVFDTQAYTSMGQSVELYVNGEYRGVYYLCEQIQIKDNRVNITQEDEEITNPADVGYLVEMDGWAIKNASSTPNLTTDGDVYVQVGDSLVSNRRYVIKDPEDMLYNADGTLNQDVLSYVQGFISDALGAATGCENGVTYAEVEELIDVKSFAQAYIIFELFKNPDTNYSSVYFYKDAGGKFTCGPVWDFDMAVGNVSHKGNGVFAKTDTLWTATQNPWFKGLLQFDEFRALVASELNANKQAIENKIAECIAYAREHASAYERNFGDETEWEIGESTFSIPTYLQSLKTWEEQVAYVENYLAESLANLIIAYPYTENQ